jgi:hypothetical protein
VSSLELREAENALSSGYHQTTAYKEIKKQVNLPEQQLDELLTRRPLAVTKHSK